MHPSIQALRDSAERAGILLDFDGTLSEIVFEPDLARPFGGVPDILRRLAARYRVVSIVSGRSADQLLEWLGPAVDIWGVHGAQRVRDGRVELSAIAAPFEEKMQRVLREAEERVAALGIEGVIVEDKRVMVGLHFRAAVDRAAAEAGLDAIARDLIEEHGLRRAGGRLAIELRPPIELSKEAVVLTVAREYELGAALFAGDDVVDLPGFDALDRLDESGLRTVRVAVTSDEAPRELLDRADVTVAGPRGMIELLQELL